MPKSVEEQRAEFSAGIVAVHRAFADFENAFAMLLVTLLQADGDIAFALYFSPNATEARVLLVDAALTASLKFWEDEDIRNRVERQWKDILNRANRCRKTRNSIIHGQVSTFGLATGEVVRLSPLMFDGARARKEIIPQLLSGQLPGMSANDLRQNATALDGVTSDVQLFSQVVYRLRAMGDGATSLQKLVELEARHSTEGGPRKDDPTPPAPKDPPEASGR